MEHQLVCGQNGSEQVLKGNTKGTCATSVDGGVKGGEMNTEMKEMKLH